MGIGLSKLGAAHLQYQICVQIDLSLMSIKTEQPDDLVLSSGSEAPQTRVITSTRVRSAVSTRTTGIDSLRPAYSRHETTELNVNEDANVGRCSICTIL